MAATLDSFFGKKDDLRVPYGRGKKPDSEKSVDLRSDERLMSKSPLAEENKLKAVKLCTGDGMKNLQNPAPLETLAMDPENKSIISGVFVNSNENKDKDRASVKVYTRRVGQEVFWDTKLQRYRPLEELTRDPEIRDELRDYKMFQVLKESEMESEMDLRMMGYSDNLRINADNCWDSMELEHPATFEELGMDPENKGIISDFFGFVRANELCKRIGQASKRDNWLVYDSPGTGRSSLIAAMANHLKFDIYHLDLTSFSSLKELEYTLLSTRDHSVIAIEGLCQFAIEGLYRCHKMRLDLRSDEFVVKCLMIQINSLFLRRDNERIFVFTTNHRDQRDAASLRPFGMDIYINTSSPLPTSLPDDGGKRTYHNSLLVSNLEKENTREAYDSTKRYSLPNFDAPETVVAKVYSRQGRDWLHLMELERPPTFTELGKDPENEGIISDLLRFVRDKEFYMRIGKDWKRGYLLYDSPGTDRSSLIAAMANYLNFDIYDLDLSSLSSIHGLQHELVSVNNRSLIAIKYFDHWFGKHPNLKKEVKSLRKENELTLSGLFEIIEELLKFCLDQQIIVVTTNHNHRDRYHTTLLSPLNIDAYMHTSSPQSIALPDGGEIVEHDSLEQKPMVDFDATNNGAYESSILVSNSEKENARETSKRRCMTESVLSSDDSRTRIPLIDFVTPDYRADLVRAYQNGPIMFTSDNKDTREGLNGECLTKSVLSDDDLTKQDLLPERTSLAFSELTSEDIDGFYNSISVDSDSDDFDDGAGMLPDLKDEFVDGLSSSYGDERITISTSNHRDPHDAALLPLVNMDADIHMASPHLIAIPDGGEIVQLESIERKPLLDFDATNNRAYQSGVLVSSKKKNTVEAYKGQWDSLIQRTKKDMGEGSNEECLTKSALSLDDSTEQNSINPRRGRGRLHSMEHKQPVTSAELGTDPKNEGIVYDLLRFVREEEFYKRVGKAWKRGYLLYDPPCTNRSSLMAYMANRLEFDIHDLDLTSLSSIEELTNLQVSIRNGSLIAIKDFDHWVGMLPNLKNEQLMLLGFLEIIHCLLSSCGDERIIILTTNHNHIDRVDAALLRPLIIVLCLHTSSPQPMAVADGGEIVQLYSSEQKPLGDFDATSNRAFQSDILVSNSKGKSTKETSKRQCMPESILSLVDSTTRISSTDFNAPNSSAHLEKADQSGLIVFNSETKDSGEGLIRECFTKSVLSFDYSSRQKSLPDVDNTKNEAHLVRSYRKGLVVSLSKNKKRGEALKRECIAWSVLGLEDLQQHFGSRLDAAAKNFGAIYDPGIHTTDSLARKSFKVVETLPIREQPNDCVPLLSIGKLTLKGWVQEEKSPNLPRVLQLNIVEQRVTKLPICLEGLTAEFARAPCWSVGLPDGRHIVVLHPLEQSTKNVAHAARVDQCSPTVSLPEKKMVRKTSKRKCRTMSVMEIHHQHFGRRCEGSAKNFRAMPISRKHVSNWVSTEKRIHRIHQWSFCQKWATRKGYSSGDEKSFEISSLSMDEKLDSGLLFIQMSKFAGSSPQTLALPDGGEIVGPIASPSSEFVGTNDRPHLVRQDQSGSTASHHERKNTREMSDRQEITMSSCSVEDLQQHFSCKHKDAVKRLDVSISMFKSTFRQHRGYWWPCRIEKNEARRIDTFSSSEQEAFDQSGPTASNLEKENSREALKRECKTKSVLSLEDLQHQYGGRHKNAGKGLCKSLARKPFEERQESRSHKLNSLFPKSFIVLHVLPLWEQSNNIRHLVQWRRLALKCWVILKKSQDLPRTLQIINCSGSLTAQSASSFHWPISLPDGGRTISLLEKKIMRKSFKRKYSAIGVSFEDHQQHFSSRCGCAANSHGAKCICEQRLFNLVSTVKRIRRQYGIHRCTFRQNWATMLGYSFRGESPAGVLSPSMEERVVSRLQFLHISWLAISSRHPLALRSGSEILGHIAFSSNELAGANNGAHPGRQDQRGSSASRHDKERKRETKNGEGTYCHTISHAELEKYIGRSREDVAQILGICVSTFKRVCRHHGIRRWPNPRSKRVKKPPDQLEGHTTQSTAHPNPSPLVSPQPQTSSTHMLGENEDRRQWLASRAEATFNGPVSESSNLVFHAYSDAAAPSQAASHVLQTMPMPTHKIPQTGVFFETFQLEGHPNPDALIFREPQTTSPHMLSENIWSIEDCRRFLGLDEEPLDGRVSESAMLKVKYGDITIRFDLPIMSGKSELKEEVEKRLELELGSFKVEYKDEEGDWIFLSRDEDIRNHLQHFHNQVIKLRVRDEVPNTSNFCRRCRSLKRKRQ